MLKFDWIEKRPLWQWMLGIILIGLAFRILNIDRDSLWLDEAISYLASQLPVAQIFDNSIQSSHPPLYYFFLRVWGSIVPDNDLALRSLGVLWSLLLIPLIGRVALDFFQ